MQVHETMHLACAARASLDALPAVFELMPAITYASTNGEEKTIEGIVYIDYGCNAHTITPTRMARSNMPQTPSLPFILPRQNR